MGLAYQAEQDQARSMQEAQNRACAKRYGRILVPKKTVRIYEIFNIKFVVNG